MTEGYVLDRTHGSVTVASWVEGTPERSVWVGIKLAGKPTVDIATWRCGRCGFLEQYASGGGPSAYQAQRKQVQLVVLIMAVVVALLAGGVAALLAATR